MNRILFFALSFFIAPIFMSANIPKIAGIYRGDGNECITINKDSFEITIGLLDPFILGLDENDEILAQGKVEYMGNGFIKLTTFDYEFHASRSTTVSELYDENIKDSLQIKFDFPFKGKFKITIRLGNDQNNFRYEFEDIRNIILPMPPDSLKYINSFVIQKQNLIPDISGNYFGLIVFRSYLKFDFRNKSINSLIISIPTLTNSYFGRYFINGEYVLIDKYNILRWRNRNYEKDFY